MNILFTILLTTVVWNGEGTSVNTTQIGQYKDVNECNLIASKLNNNKHIEFSKNSGYYVNMSQTAQCVQVN